MLIYFKMTYTKTMNRSGTRLKIRAYSAPLQKLRSPDDLPMDYNRDDICMLSQKQREQRLKLEQELQQKTVESENLREYSQRRFDYALQNFSKGERPPSCRKNLASFPQRPSTSTGPTMYGSVLYNKTPLLLNSVRLRPHSGSHSTYEHAPSIYPDIQKTLCHSNEEYDVVPVPTDVPDVRTPDTNDFILVPHGNRCPKDTKSETQNWESLPDEVPEGGTYTEKSFSKNDTVSASTTSVNAPQHVSVEDLFTSVDKSTDHNKMKSEKKADREKVSSHNGKTGIKARGKQRTGKSSSSSESSTVPKSACWIDNVTISSDEELSEKPQEVNVTITDSMFPQVSTQNVEMSNTHDEIQTAVKTAKEDNDQATGVEEHRELVQGLGSVVEEQTMELPSFICPSSERKSRQEAIKEWLAKTSFTLAEKTVPLL